LIEKESMDQGAPALAYATSRGAGVTMTMGAARRSVNAIAPDYFATWITAQRYLRRLRRRYRTDRISGGRRRGRAI
jgi:NAD(P)-dependent dehydrogenase (short-subunit alcohol dehydrogenase family)